MEVAIYFAILAGLGEYKAMNETRPALKAVLSAATIIIFTLSVAVYLKESL